MRRKKKKRWLMGPRKNAITIERLYMHLFGRSVKAIFTPIQV